MRKEIPLQSSNEAHISHPYPGDLEESDITGTDLQGLPSSYEMLGQTWRIHYVENLLQARGELGVTDISRHCIYIYSLQARSGAEDTLCHELLHAFLSQMGISTWIGDHDKEEQLVRFITPFILHACKTLNLDPAAKEPDKCLAKKNSKKSKS